MSNPAYVSAGSVVATKTNILGDPNNPSIKDTDVITTAGLGFAQIAT